MRLRTPFVLLPVLVVFLAGMLPAQAATDGGQASTSTGGEASVASTSTTPKDLAFSGGGFYALNNQAAYLMAASKKSGLDLSGTMQNVRGLSGTSGGAWLLSLMAWSPQFAAAISSGDVQGWRTEGYLGQIQNYYDPKDQTCETFIDTFLPSEEALAAFCPVLVFAGSTIEPGTLLKPDWLEANEKIVFAPYEANSKLKNTTLSDPRNLWATGKTLSMATTLMSKSIPITGERVYDLSNTLPPTVQTVPATLISRGTGDQASSRLLDPPTQAEYKRTLIGNPVDDAVLPGSLSTDSLRIIEAATNSSAAGAFASSVTAVGEILPVCKSLPISVGCRVLTQDLKDLAPPFELRTMTRTPTTTAENKTLSELADEQYSRFGDGGFGDNSSAVTALSSIQQNRPGEPFDITIFANELAGKPDGYNLGSGTAKLFGYSGKPNPEPPLPPGVAQQCFGELCFDIPSPQIFPKSAAENTLPKWEYSADGVTVSYSEYDVTTLENKNFGIKAGTPGKVRVFSTYGNFEPIPVTTEGFERYGQLMNVVFEGISNQGGWPYLQAALGLPSEPAPPPVNPVPVNPPTPPAASVPGKVTKLKKKKITKKKAKVTWKKPNSNGGASVTNYQYRIKKKGKGWQAWKGKKKSKLKVSGKKKFTKTFKKLNKKKKLKPNTRYRIQVRAKNSVGVGAPKKKKFRTRS